MKNLTRPQIPRNRLKTLRRLASMSQYDVELASGISQSRLSLLERSIRPLSHEDIAALAQALEVTADQLFDRDCAA